MFYGLKLEEGLSDLFSSGIKDDTVNILKKDNKPIEVKVETPFGLSDKVVLEEVVLLSD